MFTTRAHIHLAIPASLLIVALASACSDNSVNEATLCESFSKVHEKVRPCDFPACLHVTISTSALADEASRYEGRDQDGVHKDAERLQAVADRYKITATGPTPDPVPHSELNAATVTVRNLCHLTPFGSR
ncbi:hypothetical protein ACWEO2_33250 [Nocardia sp. NPDC004278]